MIEHQINKMLQKLIETVDDMALVDLLSMVRRPSTFPLPLMNFSYSSVPPGLT